MGDYLSKFSGIEVDNTIKALKNMHPQIIVSGSSLSNIECTDTSSGAVIPGYSKVGDDRLFFDISSYGVYNIKRGTTTLEQVNVTAFKTYEIYI
jgi:hypothetical protein